MTSTETEGAWQERGAHAFGKPREEPEEPLSTDDLDLTTLSDDELHALAADIGEVSGLPHR